MLRSAQPRDKAVDETLIGLGMRTNTAGHVPEKIELGGTLIGDSAALRIAFLFSWDASRAEFEVVTQLRR
ncbi:hypothetical protein FRC12_008159, partial [Ceratobasidium sp. 428]